MPRNPQRRTWKDVGMLRKKGEEVVEGQERAGTGGHVADFPCLERNGKVGKTALVIRAWRGAPVSVDCSRGQREHQRHPFLCIFPLYFSH